MSYHDRLEQEINEKLDALARVGQKWVAQWIAHEICLDHHQGLAASGIDREFWEHGGYLHTRRAVTHVINKRSGDDPARPRQPRQLILNGFDRDRLQDYYVVKRNGEEVGVPIIGDDPLTDGEIDAKADIYDAMGDACHAHADELRRFKLWRQQNLPLPPPAIAS